MSNLSMKHRDMFFDRKVNNAQSSSFNHKCKQSGTSQPDIIKSTYDVHCDSTQKKIISQNWSNEVSRYIMDSMMKNVSFSFLILEVRKIIFLIHLYNMEIAKVKKEYPWSFEWEKLLVKYIELEYTSLYEKYENIKKNEDNVRKKVMQLLMLISNDRFSFDIHSSANKNRNIIAILDLIEQVNRDIYRKRDNFLRKIVRNILERLGQIENINKYLGVHVASPFDTFTRDEIQSKTIFKSLTLDNENSYCSDTDSGISDINLLSPRFCDVLHYLGAPDDNINENTPIANSRSKRISTERRNTCTESTREIHDELCVDSDDDHEEKAKVLIDLTDLNVPSIKTDTNDVWKDEKVQCSPDDDIIVLSDDERAGNNHVINRVNASMHTIKKDRSSHSKRSRLLKNPARKWIKMNPMMPSDVNHPKNAHSELNDKILNESINICDVKMEDDYSESGVDSYSRNASSQSKNGSYNSSIENSRKSFFHNHSLTTNLRHTTTSHQNKYSQDHSETRNHSLPKNGKINEAQINFNHRSNGLKLQSEKDDHLGNGDVKTERFENIDDLIVIDDDSENEDVSFSKFSVSGDPPSNSALSKDFFEFVKGNSIGTVGMLKTIQDKMSQDSSIIPATNEIVCSKKDSGKLAEKNSEAFLDKNSLGKVSIENRTECNPTDDPNVERTTKDSTIERNGIVPVKMNVEIELSKITTNTENRANFQSKNLGDKSLLSTSENEISTTESFLNEKNVNEKVLNEKMSENTFKENECNHSRSACLQKDVTFLKSSENMKKYDSNPKIMEFSEGTCNKLEVNHNSVEIEHVPSIVDQEILETKRKHLEEFAEKNLKTIKIMNENFLENFMIVDALQITHCPKAEVCKSSISEQNFEDIKSITIFSPNIFQDQLTIKMDLPKKITEKSPETNSLCLKEIQDESMESDVNANVSSEDNEDTNLNISTGDSDSSLHRLTEEFDIEKSVTLEKHEDSNGKNEIQIAKSDDLNVEKPAVPRGIDGNLSVFSENNELPLNLSISNGTEGSEHSSEVDAQLSVPNSNTTNIKYVNEETMFLLDRSDQDELNDNLGNVGASVEVVYEECEISYDQIAEPYPQTFEHYVEVSADQIEEEVINLDNHIEEIEDFNLKEEIVRANELIYDNSSTETPEINYDDLIEEVLEDDYVNPISNQFKDTDDSDDDTEDEDDDKKLTDDQNDEEEFKDDSSDEDDDGDKSNDDSDESEDNDRSGINSLSRSSSSTPDADTDESSYSSYVEDEPNDDVFIMPSASGTNAISETVPSNGNAYVPMQEIPMNNSSYFNDDENNSSLNLLANEAVKLVESEMANHSLGELEEILHEALKQFFDDDTLDDHSDLVKNKFKGKAIEDSPVKTKNITDHSIESILNKNSKKIEETTHLCGEKVEETEEVATIVQEISSPVKEDENMPKIAPLAEKDPNIHTIPSPAKEQESLVEKDAKISSPTEEKPKISSPVKDDTDKTEIIVNGIKNKDNEDKLEDTINSNKIIEEKSHVEVLPLNGLTNDSIAEAKTLEIFENGVVDVDNMVKNKRKCEIIDGLSLMKKYKLGLIGMNGEINMLDEEDNEQLAEELRENGPAIWYEWEVIPNGDGDYNGDTGDPVIGGNAEEDMDVRLSSSSLVELKDDEFDFDETKVPLELNNLTVHIVSAEERRATCALEQLLDGDPLDKDGSNSLDGFEDPPSPITKKPKIIPKRKRLLIDQLPERRNGNYDAMRQKEKNKKQRFEANCTNMNNVKLPKNKSKSSSFQVRLQTYGHNQNNLKYSNGYSLPSKKNLSHYILHEDEETERRRMEEELKKREDENQRFWNRFYKVSPLDIQDMHLFP